MKSKIQMNLARLALVLVFGFTCTLQIHATHIVAGNITYKHISGDDYQVTLTLRRDCLLGDINAQFDDPASVWIFTSDGELATSLANSGKIRMPFMASDTLNEYIRSDCGFEGTQVCVHQTTYRANVRLPYSAGGYILAYQRCCRNETILNIIDPKQTGATYWTEISESALQLRNSSPVFKEWPDVYICANKPLIFDHGATDADGDSLVYRLCTPSSGATFANPKPSSADPPPYDLVSWRPPYGLTDMFGGTPLKIDPKTGLFTGMPNLVGQFLIGVCVDEYRNGTLIGSTRRDFQYNIRVCSQPPLAAFTTSESNCDGLTVEFYNNSLSSNGYQWDFNYPSTDPIFKSSQENPVFTFPQSGVYKVRLKSTRNTDGCFDTLLQEVAVFTNKINPAAKFSLSGCAENSDSITIKLSDISSFNEPGYSLVDWEWTVTQNNITKMVTGEDADVKISKNGIVNIVLKVKGNNGCISNKDFIVNPQELIPQGDFNFAADGCKSPGLASLKLDNVSAQLNPFATIANTFWTVNGVNATGSNVHVELPQNTSEVLATMVVAFQGQCEISISKSFSLQSLFPATNATLTGVECPQNDMVTLNLNYSDSQALGLSTTQQSWSVTSAGNTTFSTSNDFSFTVPKDSLVSYQLISTFANGCVDTIQASVIPGPYAQIRFEADTLILCPSQEKSFVTYSNPNWQYTWSPTEGLDLTDRSNPIVSIDKNTTYYVTVTDGLCSVVDSIDVIALSGGVDLSISGDSISCNGIIDLSVTGGIGQGTYFWGTDPNLSNVIGTGDNIKASFTGLEETFYVQFVGQSCSTEPAQIKVMNQIPRVEDASPWVICKGDTSKILTINLEPLHQNTIFWQPNSHLLSGGDTYTPIVVVGSNEVDPFYLPYQVTNQFGCTLLDTFYFEIGQNPEVSFTSQYKECGQNEFCFELEGNYQGFISWNFGDQSPLVPIIENPCHTYSQPGTYMVHINNLIDRCPFKSVSKTIVVNPPLSVQAGTDKTLCAGDTLILAATSNVSTVDYQWIQNGNIVGDTNTYQIVPTENGIFVSKITDQYGCTKEDSVFIKIFKFEYDIAIADSLCVNENSTINLNITDPASYDITWTPPNIVIAGSNTTTPTIRGIDGSTITLNLKHKETGCVTSEDIKPKVTKPFELKIEAPSILCVNKPVTITLNIDNPSKYNYQWSPSDCFVGPTNVQNPMIQVSQDKTVKVLVTEISSGCKQELPYLAKAGSEINVDIDAQPDFTIYEGKSLDLYIKDGNQGETYMWSNGEKGDTITVMPTETTTYTVTVTDLNGCTGTDKVTVEVRNARCDESDIFIPNAFSPNQDGFNDVLYVRSNFIDNLEIIIYNRWGQEVFRSKDQNIGWDGTLNGEDLAPDAYAYYLKANCINGETYTNKGNVSLLR